MRFQIDWTPKSDDGLLQIRYAEKVVPVTPVDGYAGYTGTGWTWIDRSEYTLVCPLSPFPAGQTPEWYIFSNGDKRLTGKLQHLPWHKQIVRASIGLEWDLDGRAVVEQSVGCCRKELRFRGGRRLALWRFHPLGAKRAKGRRWVEGVSRNSLPPTTVQIVLGMVLASLPVVQQST